MNDRYQTFHSFYPYYLSEHRDPVCRTLHFIGSTMVLQLIFAVAFTQIWWLLWFVPLAGYGFAWIGHFFFEKNRPATFKYPLFSLMGDWVMYWQLFTRQIKFDERNS